MDRDGGSLRGRRIRVVFEGGGAKGISHVGALKALERAEPEIVGFAGTSAGAIVAALAAAGLSADEIFDPGSDRDILKSYGRTPLELIGTVRWWGFRFLQSFSVPAFNMVSILAILLMLMAMFGDPWSRTGRILAPAMMAGLVACLSVPLIFFVVLTTRLGFLTTEDVGRFIDEVLSDRIDGEREPEARPRGVTFGDLAATGGPDLKVIATDMTDGELALFDAGTADIGVGLAVAASTAIPIAFRPVAIDRSGERRLHVDGGLVSNLPCWAFAEFAARGSGEADVPVVAFRLGRGGPPRRWPFVGWVLGRLGIPNAAWLRFASGGSKRRGRIERHLMDVFETGMSGSQRVVERLVPGLHVVESRSPLSTYDFDGTRDMLREAHEEGRRHAAEALEGIARSLRDVVEACPGREVHAAYAGWEV